MKNAIKFLGIIALVALIGFSMAACDTGGGGGGDGDDPTSVTYSGKAGGLTYTLQIDKAGTRAVYNPVKGDAYTLTTPDGKSTGTVINISGGGGSVNSALNGTWVNTAEGIEMVLNNGDITYSEDNVEAMKGTYSTNGSTITITFTQVRGAAFGEDAPMMGLSTSEWYTKTQLRTIMIQALVNNGYTQSDAENMYNTTIIPELGNTTLAEMVNQLFTPGTGTYTSDTLTVTLWDETSTLTRTGGGNSALNGTWVNTAEGLKMVLNNGDITMSIDNVEAMKGTYSASGSNVTITFTQTKGALFEEDAEMMGLSTSQWYTKEQLRTTIIQALVNDGHSQSDAENLYNSEVAGMVNQLFTPGTGTYSGDTLTVTIAGETSTLTRTGGSSGGGDTFSLSKGGTVAVSSAGITSIDGTITLDAGGTCAGPGTVTPTGIEYGSGNPGGNGPSSGKGWPPSSILSKYGAGGMPAPAGASNISYLDGDAMEQGLAIQFTGTSATTTSISNWFASNGWEDGSLPEFGLYEWSKNGVYATHMTGYLGFKREEQISRD